MKYEKKYNLPYNYSVAFSFDDKKKVLNCVWSPFEPFQIQRTEKFLDAYRKARDEFLSTLDVNVLVVEG